jgi:hypothetical protein
MLSIEQQMAANDTFDFKGDAGAGEVWRDAHRLAKWEVWNKDLEQVMFVLLAPSARAEDRAIRLARDWGVGGVYIATLKTDGYVRGPGIHQWLGRMADRSDMIVACWGDYADSNLINGVLLPVIFKDKIVWCIDYTSKGNPMSLHRAKVDWNDEKAEMPYAQQWRVPPVVSGTEITDLPA